MEFDKSHNVHCIIKLNSGREIILDSLRQSRTYAEVIMGIPYAKINQSFVERKLNEAESSVSPGSKPFLIEPIRRDYFLAPGDADDMAGDMNRRGKPEWLPAVACIGRFHSWQPARDQEMLGSLLTLVWFQPEFGVPDAQFVSDHLATVDWDSHAEDSEMF